MMNKKHRWLWILLFIFVAVLLGVLATGWNIVIFRDHQNFLELAKKLPIREEIHIPEAWPILRMILGTLGFVAALGLTVLLFIKLLNEMRLNQIQSEFLATVSHELKTPLASIELTSGLLQTGKLTSHEISLLWNSHQKELKRLKEEVNALLEAARWQSKALLHKVHLVNVENWIQQSIESWKHSLGPQATLVRLGDPLPIHSRLDLRSLDLIMNNLLNNARKFSQGAPHVILRTQRLPKNRVFNKVKWYPSQWKIEVEDHGWGFSQTDSKKIFQRFFRSRNQAPYAIPGTGLGLYLAQSASRAMNLTLSGQSKGRGQGALFVLEGAGREK